MLIPTTEQVVSPAELLLDILMAYVPASEVPGGFAVGPLSNDQQQSGAVSIMLAGRPTLRNGHTNARLQMRCIAPTLDQCDRIAFVLDYVLQQLKRIEARQYSTGEIYLVHWIIPDAGPSHHRDSDATWEALLFAEMMIGEPALGLIPPDEQIRDQ